MNQQFPAYARAEGEYILKLLKANDDGSDCDALDNLGEIMLERLRELRRKP